LGSLWVFEGKATHSERASSKMDERFGRVTPVQAQSQKRATKLVLLNALDVTQI